MAVGAPTDIINIMIGTIVFFVALARVVTLIAERLEKRASEKAALAPGSGSGTDGQSTDTTQEASHA